LARFENVALAKETAKILWLLLTGAAFLALSGCNIFGRHSILIDAHNIDRNIQSEPNGIVSIELFFSKRPSFKGKLNMKSRALRGHHIYQVAEGAETRDMLLIPDSVRRILCILKVDSQTLQVKEAPFNALLSKQVTITIIGRDFSIQAE
jgi:hypothetical protein